MDTSSLATGPMTNSSLRYSIAANALADYETRFTQFIRHTRSHSDMTDTQVSIYVALTDAIDYYQARAIAFASRD